MKKGLIFTAMLAGVLAFSFSQTAYTVRNAAGWVEAVNGIRSGGNDKEYTITITGNVSVPPSISEENSFGSVTSITVTIAGSGTLSLSSNGVLLQIGDGQTVVARDVILRGRDNNNSFSVVTIGSEGIFRMDGNAKVTGNKIGGDGGGVYVGDRGTFIMQSNSSVLGNTSGNGGGVYVSKLGSFAMQDKSSVSGNTSTARSSSYYDTTTHRGGGGVYVSGTFIMQDSATVSGNTASSDGGGLFNYGTITMRDSASVSDNTAGNYGGGVYGSITMNGGTISGNTASFSGGGVYGSITMNGGTISGNTAASSSGGGVYGSITMSGGTISGNTAKDNGGGVYNSDTLTMLDGIISGNTSSNGGGVYFSDSRYSGTFTMQGGTISGNTAIKYGGGVYMGGTFTMQGNATVTGNKTNFHGGGVYVIVSGYNDDRTFTMKDSASVSGNTASGNGGGLYIAGGRGNFIMQDNASILGNTAIGSGGGLYFNGKSFTKTGGNIYGDDAEQNYKNTAIGGRGNAVYESNNGGWRNATAGLTMNSNSYGFWLNEGGEIAVKFPSVFAGVWKRANFNNMLTFTENTVKSSSSNYVWVLTRISGETCTIKRSDNASTITITISYSEGSPATGWSYGWPDRLSVRGDSGNGQDNWNGSWEVQ